tara:strand:+ start:3028 stop:4011 length:984 start_codon:yes stop_codon:yes gene_type:complete
MNIRNILITGGNSGIGFQAVKSLLLKGHYIRILLKSSEAENSLINRLRKSCPISLINNNIKTYSNFNLDNLDSISEFLELIISENLPIDSLIFNAGLQYTGAKHPEISKQGLELTFAVNHLSHFYIFNRITPLLDISLSPRIIITSSEVHNPESPGGNIGYKANLNNLVNFERIVTKPFQDFNADKAYKDSKLCNILFAKELSIRFPKYKTIAWAPGLVIPKDSNGFFRYSRTYNQIGYFIFALLARDIFGISETVENAGEILSRLASDYNITETSFIYISNKLVSLRKHSLLPSEVSKEGNDRKLSERLWDISDQIVQKAMSGKYL